MLALAPAGYVAPSTRVARVQALSAPPEPRGGGSTPPPVRYRACRVCTLARRHAITPPVRTQIAIIGAGPAGLVLAQLLAAEGIESVVLEHRPREYVEARVR